MLIKIKDYLARLEISPTSWLVNLSGILMVRFFLESLASRTSTGLFASDASTLLHYWLFFVSFAVVFMIFIQKFFPDWKNLAPQITLIAFVAIFIAPIVDFVLSFGKGFQMAYLFDSPKQMFWSLITFFGSNLKTGITYGIRVEVFLILFATVLFSYANYKDIKKSISSALLLYFIVFIFLSLPGIVVFLANLVQFNDPIKFFAQTIIGSGSVLNNLHNSLLYSSNTRFFEIAFNFIMGKILFIILLVTTFYWFWQNFKTKTLAIIKNSRPERIVHYLLMIFLGLFIAYKKFPNIYFNWNDVLSIIVLCLAFVLSWFFAMATNDMFDEDIDRVSNPERPLIKMDLTKNDMLQVAFLSLVGSLVAGYLAGYSSFFLLISFTAIYYIYSVPPTRFKLVPFFSSFLISLCCLSAVMAGFFLLSPIKTVETLPIRLVFGVVVVFFLSAHLRDLKDVAGDRRAGVSTVPVIFGEIWGPKVVGIFVSLSFMLVPIFANIYWLFIFTLPGAFLSFYFINRKPYQEKYIFITYFICVALIFFTVCWWF